MKKFINQGTCQELCHQIFLELDLAHQKISVEQIVPYLINQKQLQSFNDQLNHHSAQLIIEDHIENPYIGIYFPPSIYLFQFDHQLFSDPIQLKNLLIILEECSHFFHFIRLSDLNQSIRKIHLEILALLDQFMIFWKYRSFEFSYELIFEAIYISTTENIELYQDALQACKNLVHKWIKKEINFISFKKQYDHYLKTSFEDQISYIYKVA